MNNILYRHRRSFLHDLAAAVKLTMEWRRAERKQYTANISARPTKTVRQINLGYWAWTMEATLSFPRGTREAVKSVFNTFDQETQRALTFTPDGTPGSWLARAKFWQRELRPYLTPEQYHVAMLTLLQWFVRRKRIKVATMEGIAS